MGPLYQQGILSPELNIFVAFLIGIGFGFILEASGFTNTRKLAGVFYGYDTTVIKVFFSAAMTASIGLFILDHFGAIDVSLTFYPKTFWIPTLVGGVMMGLGFIVGGFCPGTSLCAASTGKIDALVFVGGIFVGILGFIFTYDWLFSDLRSSGNMGRVNIADWIGISEGLFIFIMVIITIVTFTVFEIWNKAAKAKLTEDDLNELGLDRD